LCSFSLQVFLFRDTPLMREQFRMEHHQLDLHERGNFETHDLASL
jgi:hypothetical protein